MKVFFDNNMPLRLAKALNILSEEAGNEVTHLMELYPGRHDGVGDQEWLRKLLKTNEPWVIISTDYQMRYYEEAKEALRRGFTIYYLTGAWRHAPFWKKTVQCVRLWEKMLKLAKAAPGDYRVPITGTKIASVEKNMAKRKGRRKKR